mmetsp:Transcript_30290/g.85435  ORF Transcript_30290/g.85435 Transcript_30290/m.85435 type:complete len:227 (-) Transcript_30290:1429-2109(-)
MFLMDFHLFCAHSFSADTLLPSLTSGDSLANVFPMVTRSACGGGAYLSLAVLKCTDWGSFVAVSQSRWRMRTAVTKSASRRSRSLLPILRSMAGSMTSLGLTPCQYRSTSAAVTANSPPGSGEGIVTDRTPPPSCSAAYFSSLAAEKLGPMICWHQLYTSSKPLRTVMSCLPGSSKGWTPSPVFLRFPSRSSSRSKSTPVAAMSRSRATPCMTRARCSSSPGSFMK